MGLSPSSSHGNGGSLPHTQEKFQATIAAVASGGVNLTWTKAGALFGGGDDLVDLTDSVNPTIIDAGHYALTGYVDVNSNQVPPAGGAMYLDLELDQNSDADPDSHNCAPLVDSMANAVHGSIVRYCLAGASLHGNFRHTLPDPITLTFYAFLTRLS